ncbi:long-chain fatty acid-CoA ligase FAA1 [Spizellomyces punctatus DAOM BR117]|uniref:AMP-dependent synthetase/ligase domain-containing protein n=1 Tax=Spizellomyces punctatus (strain DAOM BR117) TaxID=645134 RepID=A0A0L0HSW9_SPIPD|nr:long-chain fatty acid-CoA ligase FAA1 [Spizellomyces punctatus DAOM BR117]KND04167.1 hypothetical protein SPPG_01601 [Spizellomyces punctatus DAOM BR117]|eukprot:XP_016612206.1 hypothetical protein SPPG_01601 [Spizellomyces punctatus DAOM BR117]
MALITVLAWIVISFALPIFLFGTRLGKPRAVTVGTATPTRSKPRRCIKSLHGLAHQPYPGVTTLYELLNYSVKVNGQKRAMGARRIVRQVQEEKQVTKMVDGQPVQETKKWNFYELSPFSWMTYTDVKEVTTRIGAGLRKIGLNPGDKLTLFASTSRDWQLVAHGCWTQSLTITTAYDTLGEEGLSFSLNECEVTTMFTNAELLKMLLRIGSKVTTLKRIIYNGQADASLLEQIKSAFPSYELYTLDQIQEFGRNHPVDPVPPKPEDTCCIMYTSGSTGNPKGVMLTHANIIAGVAGAKVVTDLVVTKEEYYLAYLPLAHVLELLVEQLALGEGVCIGYGSVRTLTDASVRNCRGDLRELRPTIMTGVPAVWETIRKGVATKLKDASPTKRKIFDLACTLKWQLLKHGLPTGFLDNTVFKPIKDQTGGRLRVALSGGAPMPKETQRFMTTCVTTIIQGYGMTETCAATAIQLPTDPWMLGRVGPPSGSVEIQLVAVEDTKYSPNNRPRPQGEIWIRGPSVMKGYYKNPKATAETLTEDGWLMTGDIGEFHPDGTLAIIDRKKNLVKLSNGEYIALEKLESQYKMSPYVANICVYGDSEQGFAVAIINPIEKEIVQLAQEKGIVDGVHHVELEDLCKNKQIVSAVLSNLRSVAKKADFKPAEILGNIVLAHELWTPENGFLTAAQKLKRKEIVELHKQEIDAMYAAGKQ